jgi:hypothetical protein
MRIVAVCLAAACASHGPRPVIVTTAEQSGYVKTGHYDEAVELCREFARAYPDVSCDEIGTTVEGRPLVMVRHTPPGRPIIYVQAGIHAGEIEGKDAGFAFFRDMLDGKVAPGAAAAVGFVFVPVLNPDGHERFGPNNRPNQRGPEQMGFRTNAARLNLNRDYVKADAPETQAVLRVIAKDDPVLVVDLHTTDGAKFQHDISISFAPVAARPDKLDTVAKAVSDSVLARLTALGHLPVDFYPSFIKQDDPTSGFARGEAPPRFSQEYAAARDRLGVLVETHSWHTYKERAESTYHALQAIFEEGTRNAATWQQREADASRATDALRGTSIPMVYENGPSHHDIPFRGFAYTKRPSEISGGEWIVYDETKPEVWTVPLYDELVPKVSVTAPAEGYIIDGGYAPQIAAVLDRHGISHRPITGQPRVTVDVFRATKVAYGMPFEGHLRATFEGAWTKETRTLDRGAIFVPIRNNHLRLVVQLLDPALPDSLAQWGELDTAFEQKEYMESYVAEEEARRMIGMSPALAEQLAAAIAADPELAKSPEKRLDLFYRKHPAWDERLDLLPVSRTDRIP